MSLRSEYGKGLSYCIGLFLAHAERAVIFENYMVWFNGAADHLFDMQTYTIKSDELRKRADMFQERCLRNRFGTPTKADMLWAIQEAKDLLLGIDLEAGISAIHGNWE